MAGTPVHKFDDVFSNDFGESRIGRCGRTSQKAAEVPAGELPFEGLRDLLIVLLKAEHTLGDFVLGREVAGGKCLALQDQEV